MGVASFLDSLPPKLLTDGQSPSNIVMTIHACQNQCLIAGDPAGMASCFYIAHDIAWQF